MLDTQGAFSDNAPMNKLDNRRRAQVIAALVEGNSIRSTVRMTGVAKNTVLKLLADIGVACAEYKDKVFTNLPCKRLQLGEIWSFCYPKDKNVPEDKQGVFGYGDVWTWVAIDADTKLVPSWLIARRDAESAKMFIGDLAGRLANRVQLTTDGLKSYLSAIDGAFGCDVDYAMLIKLYGVEQQEVRYSPSKCLGARIETVTGTPDLQHVSTSFIERQNLTMRMSRRRFTRLTNGFSKKIENHIHAISLHYMHYNFARIHKMLRCSPAMEAGVTNKLWSIEDIVALLD